MSDDFDPSEAAARALGQTFDDAGSGGEPDLDGVADEVDPDNDDPTDGFDQETDHRPTTVSDLRDFLLSGSSRSHREVDAAEWFDPDQGGRNRWALVAADWLDSRYPPRVVQLALGIFEEFLSLDLDDEGGTESSDAENSRLDSVAGLGVEGV